MNLIKAHFIISDIIDLLMIEKKVDPLKNSGLIKFEKKLYKDIREAVKGIDKKVLKGIKKVIDNFKFKLYSEKELNKLADKINKIIIKNSDEYAIEGAAAVEVVREAFYKSVKSAMSSKLGVDYAFGIKDTKALATLKKHDTYWIGNSYKDGVTEKVNTLLNNIPEEIPMTRKAYATYLGKNMPEVVANKNYWEVFSSNALNRARSRSLGQTFLENDIERYEVVAIIDERTSEICRMMDGTVMEVRKMVEKYKQIDEASDPEEVKDIFKWGASDSNGVYIKNGEDKVYLKGNLTGDDLQAMGLDAPPYHGRCRSTVSPIL